MEKKTTIFWFRQDLRLKDNPGLIAAAARGGVIPIFILEQDPQQDDLSKMGAASKWWLHNSLINLNHSLNQTLNIFSGKVEQIILDVLKQDPTITAVYWNRSYEPYRIKQDSALKLKLQSRGIECKTFNGSLLWEPWDITKADGSYYKVFTHFYRNGCLKRPNPAKPMDKPVKLTTIKLTPKCKNYIKNVDDIKLLPQIKWYHQIAAKWQVGEEAAAQRLNYFLKNGLATYKENRNYPAKNNVSTLSPYLHFGEISINRVWYEAKRARELDDNLDQFLAELAWREFSYYLLYHFKNLPIANFQQKFDQFPWKINPKYLKAWQNGTTGYPIVDAGMRELWHTGYIHNRVRMVVGSFLVKNLLLPWQEGARWFWDCLVDADLANNSASWQWVAGSGADAAPYFRIFNPVTQGEKFDPTGEYTKQFIPELAKMPAKYLFKPWEAPAAVLQEAGVILGKTYPKPIVSLESSRTTALEAYKFLSQPNLLNNK